MKEIKDYLHLYLGCECLANDEQFKLYGVEVTDTGTLAYDGTMIDGIHQCWWIENCDFKLILRPLSDMTEEEGKFIVDNYSFRSVSMPHNKKGFGIEIAKRLSEQMAVAQYLLSKHFDLFNLHEQGLCLYKSDLK